MMIKRIDFVLVGVLMLYGCEINTIKSETVKVYKFDGSISCDHSSGISMAHMKDELKHRKVPIIATSCGSDGLVRAAVCGIETGHINVFEIKSGAFSRARSLGYQEVAKLVDYTERPCVGLP